METVRNGAATDATAHMFALAHFPLHRSLNNFRYHKNPIFERGREGEWDDALVRDPMVFYDLAAPHDERWKLYYCGASARSEGRMDIGLAYGPSLERLRRHPANPIVRMTEPWESQTSAGAESPENAPPLNHTPYVFQLAGSHEYQMLYTGRGRDESGQHYFSTVRVTSRDGVTWSNKRRVFGKFQYGGRTYSPTKPIPIYRAEEDRCYLIFSASLMDDVGGKNEGFVGLAVSDHGGDFTFEQVIVPQDKAFSIFDPHGLVTMLGWYFLLITHDDAYAFDCDGNDGYPERWMVSRDLRTWYGSPLSLWDTYPDDGILYSHVTPLLTEAGMGYMVYDYGEPNRFGLAKVPLIGRAHNTVIEEATLAPDISTELANCYPAITLEAGRAAAVTVECRYAAGATSGVRIHVYTSYDGKQWDTEERRDPAGRPVLPPAAFAPGRRARETHDLAAVGRFMKLTVENTDPIHPVSDLRVVVTL